MIRLKCCCACDSLYSAVNTRYMLCAAGGHPTQDLLLRSEEALNYSRSMLHMDEKPYSSTQGSSPVQPKVSNSCGLFTLMNLGMVLELYGQGRPPHYSGEHKL